jgi:hypothetical protein
MISALHTAVPAFSPALSWGQQGFPDWARYEAALADIFERQYYTNHGPLARRLEQALAAQLGVRHAVCVTNDTIAMLMAVEALGPPAGILVPADLGWAALQGLLRWPKPAGSR